MSIFGIGALKITTGYQLLSYRVTASNYRIL